MRFIYIHKSKKAVGAFTHGLFKESCEKLDIEFCPINVKDFDYFSLPKLGRDDILYRGATGERARVIEKLLINDECRHFYSDWTRALSGRGTTYYYHQKTGLKVIPTIPLVPTDRNEAENFADKLGGFPIIVKALGGSKGVGVMRADSQESLVSICDFFRDESTSIILRKYIEHTYYGRLVVLDDRVVASNRTKSLDGDFRTNTPDTPNGEAYEFSKGVQKMAIEAVSVLGLKFGGVDILFGLDGSAYIAEVNFPTDFGCAQQITGIDIATQMLEYAAK